MKKHECRGLFLQHKRKPETFQAWFLVKCKTKCSFCGRIPSVKNTPTLLEEQTTAHVVSRCKQMCCCFLQRIGVIKSHHVTEQQGQRHQRRLEDDLSTISTKAMLQIRHHKQWISQGRECCKIINQLIITLKTTNCDFLYLLFPCSCLWSLSGGAQGVTFIWAFAFSLEICKERKGKIERFRLTMNGKLFS